MLKTFIERPVLSTVISIIIVILGILGLRALPITQYPDIAPPTVRVSASFPGANAQTVLESVIIPIEEQINGVENMTYMTSTASNNGRATITVYFDQNVDPDIAAVNVQNRVARATPLLPQEVKQTGVVTQKQQTSSLMFISFYSTNKDFGDTYIQNYLNINVVPALQRVTGVGEVNIFGSKKYAMRIWLDPDKMAAYGLEPSDVTAAIREQSQEAAAGALGENNGDAFSYVITYSGRYNSEKQYENIIIKALGNGDFLRLKDVARIELGAESYVAKSITKGDPSVAMAIYQTKGSDARKIIQNIKKELKSLQANFPEGMKIFIPYDTNQFLNASIEKVVTTLMEAFILVFIVVFIFLQDLRSTLIPAISVPVSIIGTFFFLNLFGYSINLLTLFALILAIGIVVDDAIVVVEVVHAKLDDGATDVLKATVDAMNEIAGAIVSITLVMAAVFIPLTFITGPTGVFYQQFGVTLFVAIIISAVNALTLSPALCAVFLKPKEEEKKQKKNKNLMHRFHRGFNRGFSSTIRGYGRGLHFLYKHWYIPVVVLLLAIGGFLWASGTMKTGFVPDEDRGLVFVNIQLPAGASLDRTSQVNEELYHKILKVPGVQDVSVITGFSLLSGQGSNYGLGFIKLDDWSKRKEADKSVDAIVKRLFGVAATIPGADIVFFSPPSIPGFGASSGFEVNLLDRAGGKFSELDKVNQEFIQKLMKRPEIQYAQSSFNTKYPQYQLDINVPLAKESGVSINSIFGTLQGYIGSIYATDFSRFGKQYRVYIQALPKDRAKKSDLNKLYVRTKSGEMAPITQFVTLKRVYGPQSVTRFNLFSSTKITGAANPGYSTGDAIKAVEEVASTLPKNYTTAFSGLTREEVNATNQTTLIFILVIVFVYFLLSAQFESYLLPLSVILSMPLGIFGAYFVTMMAGLENSVYFQIALVMLIGLLAKNAILIVEFAVQRRRAGESIVDAAIDGAKARLRPILMTSFAFVFGLMPLALASGVGAHGNRSIGTGAVGGLFIGTVLGVFVIPILFIFFQWLQEKISRKPKPVAQINPEN